ncbi:MAG: hypothetical protein QCH96_04055 [Candidatus Thermoplasmatota archaeon]|nr:hypothetical protein [Candidatus Thermoplasmatota archaeon]
MTSNKTMKIILIGAAVLLIATLNVSADETEEGIPYLVTTDIDEGTEDAPLRPVSDDKIFDDEDLLISPGPDDSYENLVAPAPGAEGDVFILDVSGSDMTSDKTTDTTERSSNLLTFPPLMIALFIGFIGLLLVVGKKTQ